MFPVDNLARKWLMDSYDLFIHIGHGCFTVTCAIALFITTQPLGPLLLTWFNFNPNMDK